MLRVLGILLAVAVAAPAHLLAQDAATVLDYGAFGVVLGIVLVLVRLLERLIDRRPNGNGQTRDLEQVLKALDKTEERLATVVRTLDKSEDRLGHSVRALDKLDGMLHGLAAAVATVLERMTTAADDRHELLAEIRQLTGEVRGRKVA